MLFNSLHFLIFLPVVLILYYLIAHQYRWILIFFASCYFYMSFVPAYILILFAVIIIDYFSGIAIEDAKEKHRKLFLVLSLLSNILLLCFFKYFAFLNENIVAAASLAGLSLTPVRLDIILPIGLSFHTFQSMSYTIEVYRGKQKAERHIGYFSNYVLFFPQMVAGPIERYEGLGMELRKKQKLFYDHLSNGFRMVLFGLFIKMAIADNIAPFVNSVYLDPAASGKGNVIAAIILFSFQIYADFFGYSTIAIGAARLLGINIIDNFRSPYLSTSVTEFWNRWHISLSTWFRDYLYIPLGGNRVRLPRWCFNILVVFTVSGLWHGASWTFAVWGALHGLMLLIERAFRPAGEHMKHSALLRTILIIKTFIIVSLIWVFFRAESFAKASEMFRVLFSSSSSETSLDPSMIKPLFFAGLMIMADVALRNSRFDISMRSMPVVARWSVYAILIFVLMGMSGTEKFPFIYFQF